MIRLLITSLVGCITGSFLYSYQISTSSLSSIYGDFHFILLFVLISLFLTILINYHQCKYILKICIKLYKNYHIPQTIQKFVELAIISRQNGLLALDSELHNLKETLLNEGVSSLVDGYEPELIRTMLQDKINRIIELNHDYLHFLNHLIVNIILTSMFWISYMFLNYGWLKEYFGFIVCCSLVMIGLFLLPIRNQIIFKNKEELLYYRIVQQGVLAIQAAQNPRVIEQLLNYHLFEKVRMI